MSNLIEMRYVFCGDRWSGDLYIRQRSPLFDAAGAVCGFSDFGPWTIVDVVDGDYLKSNNGETK